MRREARGTGSRRARPRRRGRRRARARRDRLGLAGGLGRRDELGRADAVADGHADELDDGHAGRAEELGQVDGRADGLGRADRLGHADGLGRADELGHDDGPGLEGGLELDDEVVVRVGVGARGGSWRGARKSAEFFRRHTAVGGFGGVWGPGQGEPRSLGPRAGPRASWGRLSGAARLFPERASETVLHSAGCADAGPRPFLLFALGRAGSLRRRAHG